MIRVATADDVADIRRIYAPAVRDEVTSFETSIPSEDELRQRVTTTLRHYPWLIFESDQEVTGFAYATSHRSRDAYQWSVEVSVYVDSERRRLGCGRQLYSQLFSILASQGFHSAYAGIAVPNVASQAFHESLGFQQIGVFPQVGFKHGAWRDVGWWFRALSQSETGEPALPTPFADWLASHPNLVS